MSKELLEEIKKAYRYGYGNNPNSYPTWLIERVQELEELEQEYIELNNAFTKLALENKRYRKKIEVALDISKKGSRDDIRVSNMQYVLNEALEKSE